MSSSDWYARRLGQSAPQPAPPQYPPTAPLQPGQLPPHLAPYAVPSTQPPQPNTPGSHQDTVPRGQQEFTSYDAATGAVTADDGTVAMLYNSAVQTGGSQVVKQNSSQCPNCNGGNYFTIAAGSVFSKSTGTKVSAMQCADCGYPTVQAGSTGGALASARSGGPAKAARQLPANHRVTVMDGSRAVTFEPNTGSR